jgi:3-phosphoglycerate kinase
MKSIDQVKNLKGKRVILRVDFNVPIAKGRVVDDFRILAVLPTINLLRDAGAKVIILSHVEGKGGAGKVLFKFSEDHKNLKVKGAHAFGSALSALDFKSIASLPSREVLLPTLLARLQSSLQTLMATMNEPLRGLHASLTALAKKKESTPAA